MSCGRVSSGRAPCLLFDALLALAMIATLAGTALAGTRVSIDNPTVVEGRAGSRDLVFTVSVADAGGGGGGGGYPVPRRAFDEPLLVEYRTVDLGAKAFNGDYGPVAGTLVFQMFGESQEVRVPVHGDRTYELDEQLAVDLATVENGVDVALARGIGTIINDEAAPRLSINDVSMIEGDAGVTGVAFSISLSEISGADTEVDAVTADGTARVVDGDYVPVARRIVIPAGVPSARVVIDVTGELEYETAETFEVRIANPAHATILRGTGVASILNDDAPLGPNLVGNPTFINEDGWTTLGVCEKRCAPEGATGPHSMEFVGKVFRVFGVDDSPNWVDFTPAEGTRYRVTAWVWGDESNGAARINVKEYQLGVLARSTSSRAVTLDGAWRQLQLDVVAKHAGSTLDLNVLSEPTAEGEAFHVDDVSIRQMLPGDIPPEMTLADRLEVKPGVTMAFDVVVADPDPQGIDVLAADLSGFPAQNPPSFEPNAGNTGGRLKWTPRRADLRVDPYEVRFTAVNTSAVSRTARIQVTEAPSNLVGNPGFESYLAGWTVSDGAVMNRVPGMLQGSYAVEVTNPVDGEFGINDLPEWVATVASQNTEYEFEAWVRSENDHGTARLRVCEQASDSRIVGIAYSSDVALDQVWKRVSLRYPARVAGSSLCLQILDEPNGPDESFQVDWVTISMVEQTTFDNPILRNPTRQPMASEGAGRVRVAVQPNPARDVATLSVSLPEAGPIQAELYDVSGRQVRTLAAGGTFGAGTHPFVIGAGEGAKLGKGIYFYRVRTAGGVEHGRFVMVD